jgi:hypothetical protein
MGFLSIPPIGTNHLKGLSTTTGSMSRVAFSPQRGTAEQRQIVDLQIIDHQIVGQ